MALMSLLSFVTIKYLQINVPGIWPDDADGTDVNNCCRSSNHQLVASADDFGKVNLFRYPACQPKVWAKNTDLNYSVF